MWGQILRRSGWAVCVALCGPVYAAAAAEPDAARVRLEVLERKELPKAQAEFKRHQQYCDTQLAVMHARRAMVMAEEGSDNTVWLDMEVLTAQCHVTTEQLRSQLQQLHAEQAQLREVVQKRPAAQSN